MIRKYWNTISLFLLLTLAIVILLGALQPAWAQPPGDPCPFPPCNPDVPISGIEILLAIGGFLGFRKFMNSKKDNK
jgi:hypothetical protein